MEALNHRRRQMDPGTENHKHAFLIAMNRTSGHPKKEFFNLPKPAEEIRLAKGATANLGWNFQLSPWNLDSMAMAFLSTFAHARPSASPDTVNSTRNNVESLPLLERLLKRSLIVNYPSVCSVGVTKMAVWLRNHTSFTGRLNKIIWSRGSRI